MKKAFLAMMLVSSAFIFSSANAADPSAAIVNGKAIKVSDVIAEMRGLNLGENAPKDKVFSLIRDRLVDIQLMIEAAKKAGLENDPEVKAAIQKFTDKVLLQAYVAREVKKTVTDAAIQEAYKKLPPQKEIRLAHILVPSETMAKAVIKALKSGTDFAKLAKEKSVDEATAKKGGELGSVLIAQLPQPFAEAIKDVKPGAYTESPVKTPSGYHIVKVVSLSDASFDAVTPMLREELEKEALMKLVEEQKKQAKIELFDQEGKPAVIAAPPAAEKSTVK